jgi:hypothetical protein
MGGPVTVDDEQWEQEALDARHKSLENARATAKSWAESIGLILGAFTTAAFIKGPAALTDIPAGGFTLKALVWEYEPAATVPNLVLIGALVLALALGLAAFAAQGTPHWTDQMTGRDYASKSADSTKNSISLLILSRMATAIAAALILLAMGMAWTAQVQKPAKAETTSAIVTAGDRPVCGTLSTAADGAVTVRPKGVAASAVDPGSAVTIVDGCP